MPVIRLLRSIDEPGDRGPSRGQYALQKALRAVAPDWLAIGGELQFGEIPWVWSYQDQAVAIHFAAYGWPFVIGPNVLFHNSRNPGAYPHETILTDASSCALQFTESEWYATLIRENCRGNRAPIVLWSYPIEPTPGGPLAVKQDVLVYAKSNDAVPVMAEIAARWKHSEFFIYGHYDRARLVAAARHSRVCLYLSDDDRGPLALAEILLAGCPAVGIPRGAPWIEPGVSGVLLPRWAKITAAVEEAMSIDRNAVRAWALDRFCTSRTVATILSALEPIANRS